jgi:hypothetical protein
MKLELRNQVPNDSSSPAMDQSRPEPSSPVQEIFGLGSDRSQMLTDWTRLGPDRFLTVSRVRVYFPSYLSFNAENISRWSRIYTQKWYNSDQSGYSGVSGDTK